MTYVQNWQYQLSSFFFPFLSPRNMTFPPVLLPSYMFAFRCIFYLKNFLKPAKCTREREGGTYRCGRSDSRGGPANHGGKSGLAFLVSPMPPRLPISMYPSSCCIYTISGLDFSVSVYEYRIIQLFNPLHVFSTSIHYCILALF